MKKMLSVMFMLLFLSVPVCAETVAVSENTDAVMSLMDTAISEVFDYHKVWYYEPMNAICVNVAVDGFADVVQVFVENGYDSTFEPWVENNNFALAYYNSLLEFIEVAAAEDIGLVFSFVNDKVYMDNDVTGMPATTFMTIMGGEIWYDILHEMNGN